MKDYLTILINAGYEPFNIDKIHYDRNNRYDNEPGIYISSTKFEQFNKNYVLSLHISPDDINEFIARFNKIGKILIGHCYGIEEIEGYIILKEGSNEIWKI